MFFSAGRAGAYPWARRPPGSTTDHPSPPITAAQRSHTIFVIRSHVFDPIACAVRFRHSGGPHWECFPCSGRHAQGSGSLRPQETSGPDPLEP